MVLKFSVFYFLNHKTPILLFHIKFETKIRSISKYLNSKTQILNNKNNLILRTWVHTWLVVQPSGGYATCAQHFFSECNLLLCNLYGFSFMHKIFVMRRFVHAAVQIITSLAERVRSISGDGAPFRSPQDIILKSPPCVCIQTFLSGYCQQHLKQVCVFTGWDCATSLAQRAAKHHMDFLSNFYQIAGLKVGSFCKACPWLNMLLAAEFPATWCFCSLGMQNKHCWKKHFEKMVSGPIGVELQLQA